MGHGPTLVMEEVTLPGLSGELQTEQQEGQGAGLGQHIRAFLEQSPVSDGMQLASF